MRSFKLSKLEKNALKGLHKEVYIEKKTGIQNINFPIRTIKYKKKVNRLC